MRKYLRVNSLSALHVVIACSIVYVAVFGWMSVRRMDMLWASYFDLGIMHQTVYNTYQAFHTLDFMRIFELTDPHGSGLQISRLAIHADLILILMAPFYFIFNGPQTLLMIQTIALASGAVALYFIVRLGNRAHMGRRTRIFSIALPVLYLMNFALQRSNLYEFHAVTLATPLILWMYLAYHTKHMRWAAVCLALVLATKEQVGFSIGVFLIVEALRVIPWYARQISWRSRSLPIRVFDPRARLRDTRARTLSVSAIACFAYSLALVFVVMPYARLGDSHFALSYFSPSSKTADTLPVVHYLQTLFSWQSGMYIAMLLLPLAGLPVLSLYVLPALPDLLINLLSSSDNMRNFYYHYTAVITPWLFIAAAQSMSALIMQSRKWFMVVIVAMVCSTIYMSYREGPLPLSMKATASMLGAGATELSDIQLWKQIISRDDIRVSATGQFAPHISGRRYYYDFGRNYVQADYVLIRTVEIGGYSERENLPEVYERLQNDPRFAKIYERGVVEVYKRQ